MKKTIFFLILIILISLVGCRALFKPGFYTSHDGEHQIIRLMHFHQGLQDSQFPVRWAGTAMDGNGYPLFIFTYRLPFWVAEGWYQISHNLGDSIKFAFVFSFAASGLAMYWFLARLTKKAELAFLGSVLYLWAPYRFLDIYVRAALGEAFTFIFIPIIFLGIYGLAKYKQKFPWVLTLTLGLSGIILSHIMTFLIVMPFVLLWFLAQLKDNKKRQVFIKNNLLAGALTLGLTAYYWLPAFWEKQFTAFSGTLGDYYKDHFVTIKQLIYSKWLYGFSMPGTADDMMSFQVGLAQWGIIIIVLLLSFAYLFRNLKLIKIIKSWFVFAKKDFKNIWLFLSFFIISILLMLPISNLFYKYFNRIMVIDIPWKFLTITTFSTAVLFTLILKTFKNKYFKIVCVLGVLVISFYGNRNHLRVNEYVFKAETDYWQNTNTSNQHNDYAPSDYIKYRDRKDDKLKIIKGMGNTQTIDRHENYFKFVADVSSDQAQIRTEVINYPGWKIYIDGVKQSVKEIHGSIMVPLDFGVHEVELRYDDGQLISYLGESQNNLLARKSNLFKFESRVESDHVKVFTKIANYPGWHLYIDGIEKEIKDIDGRVLVELEKGSHQVELVFRETFLRRFCNHMSLATLVSLILFNFYLWQKKQK
jgi:hypothetical protein